MLRTRLIAGPTAGFVLSAIFATAMVMVNLAETLVEPLRVDPNEAAPVTLRLPPVTMRLPDQDGGALVLRTVTPTVRRGQVVEDRALASIVRMYERSRRPPQAGMVVGLWFVYFLIAQMLTTYLRVFSPSRGSLLRTQASLLGMSLVLLLSAKLFLLLTDLSPFLIPVAAVSLWAALYLDRRTAFVVGIALSFLTASLVSFRLTSVAVFLAACLTATVVFRNRKQSGTMVLAGGVAGIAAAAVLVAARMLFESGFDLEQDMAELAYSDLLSAGFGGLLGGLVAFALEGVAVFVLGAASRRRLLDLTDLDQPLLRKMASEAPGSWEHARAMANLAEAGAAAIGADALLTRVGAYYHDLGKTVQPKYFVENLEPGEQSPHESLEPDVSADAIMAHVVEGTRILRRGGLPEPVVEFAYTHHGTSIIEYFWHKCLEQGNPKELEESFFRYPGMRPRTKETAILMLIDSIEAAARTIEPPSRDRFEEMVRRIFFVKLRQGQLDESGLTLEDIRTLTQKITDTLCSAYHSRIKYPWQSRQERGEDQLPMPGMATEKDVEQDRRAARDEAPEGGEETTTGGALDDGP
ncbi:MAG: HDIG domain-containing metalloprotein [Myxococcota bacterium]